MTDYGRCKSITLENSQAEFKSEKLNNDERNFIVFETTATGNPKKLIVHCDFKYIKGLMNVSGARKQKDGSVTLPPDPFNVEQLLDYIPELELGPNAETWYNNYLARRKKLAELKQQKNADVKDKNWLYSYQTVDVKFLSEAKRSIEASEMGTGKTPIGIAFAKEVGAKKVLIISPKSVIYNWEKEITKWDCNDVVIVDGTADQRAELLKEESKYKIINYAMLRKRKYPILFDTKWDVILFDEAHRLKNRKTQQSKGAENLKADYISMLTGSPIPNHPHELWHLLHILYPRRFKSYWRFVDRFCVTQDNFFSQVPDIVGVKNEERLKEILVPIMIRNKKKDVLKDLPPKTYKTIELDMHPEQQRIYDEMEEDMVAWIDGEPKKVANDLGKMIRLQQIALSPAIIDGPDKSAKTTALLDLLEDTDGKVVVFSWFKGYIKLLEETLKDKGYGVVTVHGEKSTKERGEAQDRFWNDDKIKVFLGTIGAAGEGVNLQCSSTLVFMDKSWVPSDNRQAEDRIHRKGQEGNATIVSFVARNSIDVDKELALDNKERIINKVMSMEKTAENLLARIRHKSS